MRYVSKNILKNVYKLRSRWVHKGQFGKLLMICGSERHTGSPIFCGLAASRAGCDLVYLAAPRRAADIAAGYSPVIITEALEGEMLTRKHIKQIIKLKEEVRATALLIGPGLWREKETIKAILELVKRIDLPMIIDADGIRAVATFKSVLKSKKAILTPHADEFKALSGKVPSFDIRTRIKEVENLARILGCVLLLKGAVDIISDGENTVLNKVHSNLMTKGGMGDTLSGICGSLLARGIDPFEAAAAAAWINGKAGLLAIRKHGEGFLATDLIECIPLAIKG